MDWILQFVDYFIHLDQYLSELINAYGGWTYAILFVIIFMETGFVVTPFLPGDSLLFAAGTFAALGDLNVWGLIGLLFLAAFLGDTANYWIGHRLGDAVYSGNIRWINQDYIDRTHAFYEKHGGKTIFLARFVPIIRSFAPFVAGVGRMSYGYFVSYNIIGAAVWVPTFTLAGYFFGNIPAVKHNFTLVIFGIIAVSLIPAFWETWKARQESKAARAAAAEE